MSFSLNLMSVSCSMPAEGETRVKQRDEISTWELKQALMCTTIRQPQDHEKEPFQYEEHRQVSVTAKIIMLCCISLMCFLIINSFNGIPDNGRYFSKLLPIR